MPPRSRPQPPARTPARPPARAPAPAPLTMLAGIAQAVNRPDAADALFGPLGVGSVEQQLEAVRLQYRKLAFIVHPDQNRDHAALASSTFAKVTELRQRRETEIEERGAPALPPTPGARRRAGTGSIVRANPAPANVVPWDDGYDDTVPPPLPACACVMLARATLPGRVVFCYRGMQDWAVRTSDQRSILVEHTPECHRYRWANPQAVIEHGVVTQGSMFSHHMPGWCWAHARLVAQPTVDHFAQGGFR